VDAFSNFFPFLEGRIGCINFFLYSLIRIYVIKIYNFCEPVFLGALKLTLAFFFSPIWNLNILDGLDFLWVKSIF